MNWIALIAGLVLLFAGRRFFWLAAGLAGFLFGFNISQNLGGGWLGFFIAVIIGLVLGWLAVKFIKIVGYIIGALAGAAALPLLLGLFGIQWNWMITAIIGAATGFLLVRFFFDWGLIIMTAWVGAGQVVASLNGYLPIRNWIQTLGFAVLMIAGILVQRKTLRK